MIRTILAAGLCALLLGLGCAQPGSSSRSVIKPAPPVITPDLRPRGRIQLVNQMARFVVITFDNGAFPALQQRLGVYRNGLKIAEVRITGPQRELNTVADIVTGDPEVHDEVKPD